MVKLSIELVPSSCWFSNMRAELSKEDWDTIRKDTYKKANYKCEICGGKGDKWPVECHEIWDYDDRTNIQKLIDMKSLCPNCHSVKHIGYARVSGNLDKAFMWFCYINNMTNEEANLYMDAMYTLWSFRSTKQWKLDISWLEDNYPEIAKRVKDKMIDPTNRRRKEWKP